MHTRLVMATAALVGLLAAGPVGSCTDDYELEARPTDAGPQQGDAAVVLISEPQVRGYLAAMNEGFQELVAIAMPRLQEDSSRIGLYLLSETFARAQRRQSFLGAAEPGMFSVALRAAFTQSIAVVTAAPTETVDLRFAEERVKLLRTSLDEAQRVLRPSAYDPDLTGEVVRMTGELSQHLHEAISTRDRIRESGIFRSRPDAGNDGGFQVYDAGHHDGGDDPGQSEEAGLPWDAGPA